MKNEKLHSLKSHLKQLRDYNNLLKFKAEQMMLAESLTELSSLATAYKLLLKYKWMQLHMIINRLGERYKFHREFLNEDQRYMHRHPENYYTGLSD